MTIGKRPNKKHIKSLNLTRQVNLLTLIVPKYSATLFMQGGGVIYDPPLSPVIAVIKVQTKKQMIKFCKKKPLNSFLTVITVI